MKQKILIYSSNETNVLQQLMPLLSKYKTNIGNSVLLCNFTAYYVLCILLPSNTYNVVEALCSFL